MITQKPYFFIYLYKNLHKDYTSYKKGFDMLARKQFGCTLTTLLTKTRTDEETNFLRRYRKYSPVIETDCVMNQICKAVERIDNSIKWDKTQRNILMDFVDFSEIDKNLVSKVYVLVKKYNSRKSVRGLQILADNEGINDDDLEELFRGKIYTHKDKIREEIKRLFDRSGQDESFSIRRMFNHVMYMAASYNMDFDIVWEIMGDYIIECIPWGETDAIIKNEKGEEYLGNYLRIKEVE